MGKLRGLKKPTIITKSRSFDEQKQKHENTQNNEKEIKIKRKLSVKLNKVFNLKQKSDSNPSTPTSQKNQTSQIQQQRPSIIIGATYSHSDNEMIEKMHHKKKKKKRTKLKK